MSGKDVIGLSGETAINRQDYGVSWNKTMDQGGLVVDDNVKLDLQKQWGVAHSGYWDDAQFYNDIAKRFL
jgi:hypothetical protein